MHKLLLTFGALCVEKWADFSGDYNPIHFDMNYARLLGVDKLVVHGMLVMLPVKNEVYKCAGQYDVIGRGWQCFQVSLRLPVMQSTELNVDFDKSKNKNALQFVGFIPENKEKIFRGKYLSLSSSPSEQSDLEVILKGSNVLPSYISKYIKHFESYSPVWMVIDSIIFADFMSVQCKAVLAHIQPRVMREYGEFDGEELVVQISHEVVFDNDHLPTLNLKELCDSDLSYEILYPSLIPSKNEIICNLEIPVSLDGRMVMKVFLGLFLKRKVSL